MENLTNMQPATLESVWAAFRETDRLLKESGERFDRELEKSREAHDLQTAELKKLLKELSEQVGGWGNSHGLFAEEYFINSFKKGNQTFFGEKFDDYENNLKGIEPGFKDEYDFVFFNCNSIGIVEVKFKARDKDVDKVINKANTFRVNYPKYQNHRFYLGLAALVFENQTEQNCIDNGIAIIKQVGDTVVINDEHLKVY